ncbi:SDR family oxidoreductase [Candidatus Puniceispirillum sp.]|uniref:SDR family oxidoreductase n=1 Tax=Candidatus Puniceispirillum sp. TaxID=2026719 RepID=UPI003F69DCBD
MLDFGIANRNAIVCASSKGLGFGCADALAGAGVNVTMCARGGDVLRDAAKLIRDKHDVKVTEVVCDVTTDEGRAALLDATGDVDILVNNAGGPPPGDFRDWTRETWITALDANMLAAFSLIQAVIDPMIERKFGRIVNITSGSVKSPIPALGLSNGARAALTGFCAGLSRQVAEHNVTINGLLPGQFNTDRIESLIANSAKNEGRSPDDVRTSFEQATPAKRLGEIEEFGFACAWMCSAHSGFLTGQNILIDGGKFNSTL